MNINLIEEINLIQPNLTYYLTNNLTKPNPASQPTYPANLPGNTTNIMPIEFQILNYKIVNIYITLWRKI